jgi:hypothetical protein
VQLAAALEIHATDASLTLLSADAELNTAATAEGLSVEDPNSHPEPISTIPPESARPPRRRSVKNLARWSGPAAFSFGLNRAMR